MELSLFCLALLRPPYTSSRLISSGSALKTTIFAGSSFAALVPDLSVCVVELTRSPNAVGALGLMLSDGHNFFLRLFL